MSDAGSCQAACKVQTHIRRGFSSFCSPGVRCLSCQVCSETGCFPGDSECVVLILLRPRRALMPGCSNAQKHQQTRIRGRSRSPEDFRDCVVQPLPSRPLDSFVKRENKDYALVWPYGKAIECIVTLYAGFRITNDVLQVDRSLTCSTPRFVPKSSLALLQARQGEQSWSKSQLGVLINNQKVLHQVGPDVF